MARSGAGPVTMITGTKAGLPGASFCMTESMPMAWSPSTAATLARVPGWSFIENRR